jgi:hypothetical protein
MLPSTQNSSVYLTVNALLCTTSISKTSTNSIFEFCLAANGVCILFFLGYFSKPKQKIELSEESFEVFVVV